ncbi:hypothetical protein [Nonomuraea sp. CA-141351]|uniref:hypothetical protein n=1 Tax=Nonomuraea sp. CA-141351 TaxID=3239996 RepID=UPI003D94156A
MEVPHTASPADLLGEPIPEAQAAAQNAALDQVLEHLKAAGVHAQLIKRLAVKCAIEPEPFAATLWYPPQLKIYADGGGQVATISIGRLSGSYMVELWGTWSSSLEVVPASKPRRVGLLVARNAGAPGMRGNAS